MISKALVSTWGWLLLNHEEVKTQQWILMRRRIWYVGLVGTELLPEYGLPSLRFKIAYFQEVTIKVSKQLLYSVFSSSVLIYNLVSDKSVSVDTYHICFLIWNYRISEKLQFSYVLESYISVQCINIIKSFVLIWRRISTCKQ